MWQKYIIAGASNKHGVIGGPFGRDGCALGSLELPVFVHISFSLHSWKYNNMVLTKFVFTAPLRGPNLPRNQGSVSHHFETESESESQPKKTI